MDKVIVIRHSDAHEDSGYQEYKKLYGKHFSQKLLDYADSEIKNSNGSSHMWSTEDVQKLLEELNFEIPNTSTIHDVTYTANMAYADFFPDILTEMQCIKYAISVANNIDGYEGIQFCRWVADQMGKDKEIDWKQFM